MAAQITIPILRDSTYVYNDRVELEIDGTAQTDKLRIWGSDRRSMGFGHGSFGTGLFGFTVGAGFGDGPFGLGPFGLGVDVNYYNTTSRFPAGDYPVRARAHDALGNAGDWSSSAVVSHRPTPAAPKSLSIDPLAGTFCWQWDETDNG